MTTVVNISRGEEFDVYIGRPGKGMEGYFGNPYPLEKGQPRGATIEKFRAYFEKRIAEDPEFRRRVLALRGKRLGCFCKPAPCHGDVMAEYIDGTPEE